MNQTEFVRAWAKVVAGEWDVADLVMAGNFTNPSSVFARAYSLRKKGVDLPHLGKHGRPRTDVEHLNRIYREESDAQADQTDTH